MKTTPIPISGTFFFWAGFVCSISFMEAWLKFRAPGVTLETGLSIGKLIFTALNRMEWVFVLILMIMTLPRIKQLPARFNIMGGCVLFFLVVQTFFLLPALNQRAEMIIAGIEPESSPVHILFGIFEILKVLTLLYLGWYAMKLSGNRSRVNDNMPVT